MHAIVALASGEWWKMGERAPLTELEAEVAALTKNGMTKDQALIKLGYGHLAEV